MMQEKTYDVYCPHCNSMKPMRGAGYAYTSKGKVRRYQCRNKSCYRFTIKPLKSK